MDEQQLTALIQQDPQVQQMLTQKPTDRFASQRHYISLHQYLNQKYGQMLPQGQVFFAGEGGIGVHEPTNPIIKWLPIMAIGGLAAGVLAGGAAGASAAGGGAAASTAPVAGAGAAGGLGALASGAGKLGGILSTAGKVAGDLSQGMGQSRQLEAEYNARLAQLKRSAPADRARDSIRGDVMANVQPVQLQGEGRNLSYTGGLNAGLISPNSRQLGQGMSRQALLSSMGQGGDQDPYGSPAMPKAGMMEKVLGGVDIAGSIFDLAKQDGLLGLFGKRNQPLAPPPDEEEYSY